MNTLLAWWDRHTTAPQYFADLTPAARLGKRRSTFIARYILGCWCLQLAALPFEVYLNISAIYTSLFLSAPLLGVALFFNRRGNITSAGIIIITVTLFSITAPFVNGIGLAELPAFALLIIPLIVTCAVLRPEWIFVHLAFNLALITAGLLSPLNDPAVLSHVRQQPFGTFLVHFALQGVVTWVVYLVVKNLNEATQRADRAEESARFQRAVAMQENALAKQSEQFEQALSYFVEMHTRAANGKFTPLLPTTEDPALLQLIEAINNELGRLQRLQRDSADLQALRTTIAFLVARMRQARLNPQSLELADGIPRGSPLAPLIEELANSDRFRRVQPPLRENGFHSSP